MRMRTFAMILTVNTISVTGIYLYYFYNKFKLEHEYPSDYPPIDMQDPESYSETAGDGDVEVLEDEGGDDVFPSLAGFN